MDLSSVVFRKLLKKDNKSSDEIKVLKYELPAYFTLQSIDKASFVRDYLKHMMPGFLSLLQKDSFYPLTHPNQKPFYTFGMITSLTGKASGDALFLLNTIDSSNTLVPVTLEGIKRYSLVNGQVVALKAINPAGNRLVATKIYAHPVLKRESSQNGALDLIIINGPLCIKSIEKVVSKAALLEISTIILLGPCSELSNMDEYICNINCALEKYPTISFIYIPSLEDYAFINVIPQPGVDTRHKRFILPGNPARLIINGHLISFMNYDLLKSLKKLEILSLGDLPNNDNDPCVPSDIRERLSHHLAFSLSFIPLFPSPWPCAYGGAWPFWSTAADVIITRSEMPSFSLEAGCTFCVNTGSSTSVAFTLKSQLKDNTVKYATEAINFQDWVYSLCYN